MNNYRYTLRRDWNAQCKGIVNFIMLNPSTADDRLDDPTIRRCIRFAKRWGFSGLSVTNLFAFRATDPEDLVTASADPALVIGPQNDAYILQAAHVSQLIVCAWGNRGGLLNRDRDVMSLLCRYHLWCIRITAQKNPAHPVREPYTNQPERFIRGHEPCPAS